MYRASSCLCEQLNRYVGKAAPLQFYLCRNKQRNESQLLPCPTFWKPSKTSWMLGMDRNFNYLDIFLIFLKDTITNENVLT